MGPVAAILPCTAAFIQLSCSVSGKLPLFTTYTLGRSYRSTLYLRPLCDGSCMNEGTLNALGERGCTAVHPQLPYARGIS